MKYIYDYSDVEDRLNQNELNYLKEEVNLYEERIIKAIQYKESFGNDTAYIPLFTRDNSDTYPTTISSTGFYFKKVGNIIKVNTVI